MSHEENYILQATGFNEILESKEGRELANTWFCKDTADYWRHARAYRFLNHLTDKNSSWLTIGDGRWGLDSIRIKEYGFSDVLPTDISEVLLLESKKNGKIANYSVENAEKLSFADNQFDYVFCKESYHHFPRPYIALYEMLRVAKKGIFLIEPNDSFGIAVEQYMSSLQLAKFLERKHKFLVEMANRMPTAKPDAKPDAKTIEKNDKKPEATPDARPDATTDEKYSEKVSESRWKIRSRSFIAYKPDFEANGNFVYGLSRSEIYKVAFGLNLPQILFSGYNDIYIKGVEFEPADPTKSPIFKELLDTIKTMDKQTKQGKQDYSMLMVGIMKEELDEETIAKFQGAAWAVVDLKRNPSLSH